LKETNTRDGDDDDDDDDDDDGAAPRLDGLLCAMNGGRYTYSHYPPRPGKRDCQILACCCRV
jgi:hypothetical protein